MNLSVRWLDCLKEVEKSTEKMGALIRVLLEQEADEPEGVWAHRLSWRGKDQEPGMAVRVNEGQYEVDYVTPRPIEVAGAWATKRFEGPEAAAQFIVEWLKVEKA